MVTTPSTLADHTAITLDRLSPDHELLLVVDQLEQVFTRCTDKEKRDAFLANLASLGANGPNRSHVVVTVRSDFLGDLMAYRELGSLLTARHLLLGPLDAKGLREAIQRPAWAAGLGPRAEAGRPRSSKTSRTSRTPSPSSRSRRSDVGAPPR